MEASYLLKNSLKKIRIFGFSCCLLAGYILSNPVLAAEKSHYDTHQIATFIHVLDNSETETVINIEYEFKFDQNWGAGVIYEDVNDTNNGTSSTIGSVYFYPSAGWRFGLGAGNEKPAGFKSQPETLYRIGVAYQFNVGNIGIAPSFNVDKVDGEIANVYGVAVVYSF